MLAGSLLSFLFSLILPCIFFDLLVPGHAFLVALPYPFACERLWQAMIRYCPLKDYLWGIVEYMVVEHEGCIVVGV